MAENYFGITDPGKVRDNNEDTFIAETIADGKFIAACVIDGVGGYEGGEIAARIARECIEDHLHNSKGDLTATMSEALITSNQKIYNENQQRNNQEPMACVLTLALADITNNLFHYAHIGDTRLYLLRDNSLIKVTKDHSFVGFLEDSGRLTEDDAMKHPKRNEINKALGFDPQIQLYSDYIETGASPFLPGDLMMLCSDGLTDMVTAADITSMLTSDSTLKEKAKALVDAANNAGGKDNVTVVLVKNDRKPVRVKAAKPARTKKTKQAVDEPTLMQLPTAPIVNNDEPLTRNSNSRMVITVLSILCVLLLAALIWQVWKNEPTPPKPSTEPLIIKNRNAQEARLQDIINMTVKGGVSLGDSIYGKTIVVSDTIKIQNDSLHLDGKGIVLRADPDYKGPGLFVSTNSKSVMLENIVLENFDVGLLTRSRSVYLMNVQFRNCRVSMQYQHSEGGKSYLSGGMTNDTIFQIPD
ncbi:MAG TPA: protein phosphatase 2C domain-containing protein [Chitinophagaceae bacterium]